MKHVWGFLKTKGFYIALGTGLVAFAGLMAMYDYNGNRKKASQNEQAIDLNQPVQSGDADTASEKEPTKEHVPASSGNDAVVSGKKNEDKKKTEAATEAPTTAEAVQERDVYDPEVVAASGEPVYGAGDVSDYDGTQVLAWPIVGTILLPYSMDQTIYFATLDCYRCNPGMMIAGNEGEPVYAVYDGVISSVTSSKEFGTTVVIDLGNGYTATYGQLQNVTVNEGDRITKAQPVGEVGPVSAYYEKEGAHLYFAMTKDDEPINPILLMQ